ncbi:terminase gpA endonuclease subunit, partial [Candidatus Symbiopectobacterium sp. NZEC135]
YEFWRQCRRDGLHKRVYLFKGDSTKRSKLISKTFPNNIDRQDRRAEARGDVPLYLLQTDPLKDRIDNALQRETPGANYIHFPDWLGEWFYDELTYEERGPDGKWRKPGRGPNEAFDLMVYAHALVILRGYDKINWDNPPQWVTPSDDDSPQQHRPAPRPTQPDTTTSAREIVASAWAPINSSGGWV